MENKEKKEVAGPLPCGEEKQWGYARAQQLRHLMQLDRGGDTAVSEAFLWGFVWNIESGSYDNMDEEAPRLAVLTRAVLLRYNMQRQTLHEHMEELKRHVDYCYAAADAERGEIMTVRYAENMLSACYLELGDYLSAADHSIKSLRTPPPPGLQKMPSDTILYTNQLLIYTALRDVRQMQRLMEILENTAEDYAGDSYTEERVEFIMRSAAQKLDYELSVSENGWLFLDELYQNMQTGEILIADTTEENLQYALNALDMVAIAADDASASPEQRMKLLVIVRVFARIPEIFPFNAIQNCMLFYITAGLEWTFALPELEQTLAKCLQYAAQLPPAHEVRMLALRFAAVVCYSRGQKKRSLALAREALESIREAGKNATACLNDHKISQMLVIVQRHFSVCYALLRTQETPAALYETMLRFKALNDLVARERNRILKSVPYDAPLRGQLVALQDRLARAEMDDALRGTDSAQAIYEQLQSLEAAFAAQFSKAMHYTDISFKAVGERLPKGSALVEYCFTLGQAAVDAPLDEPEGFELDIFVTRRGVLQPRLQQRRISAGEEIAAMAERFSALLQDEDSDKCAQEKEELRCALAEKLLAPVLPLLEGVDTLYLAPDGELNNLPLEILPAAEDGRLLQDCFRLCRLVCGRDLLFFDDKPSPSGSAFVLGNPDYDTELGAPTDAPSDSRSATPTLAPVHALPFSALEAELVARHCQSQACLGQNATKNALKAALPCRILHLATHGVFDEQQQSDALYSSQLVFAGYNRWISQKREGERCGNGLLTADEISRMDLSATELVVLSACQSGLGNVDYGGAQGLVSAFSAAGARWIVSHLWKADDVATAVLMDAFYRAYCSAEKPVSVPEALVQAKNYLRTVTVGELRRTMGDKAHISASVGDFLAGLQSKNERRKPFANERYWGGFSVHRAR